MYPEGTACQPRGSAGCTARCSGLAPGYTTQIRSFWYTEGDVTRRDALPWRRRVAGVDEGAALPDGRQLA